VFGPTPVKKTYQLRRIFDVPGVVAEKAT
jgi:hypothetical protein